MAKIERFPIVLVNLIAAGIIFSLSVNADDSFSRGNPKSGHYAVGFTNFERYDYSRTYTPKRDYFGRPLEGERARPLQVCVWYPATMTDKQSPMVLEEYLFPYPKDNRFFDFLSTVQDREIQYLQTTLRISSADILNLLSIKVKGILDAPSVKGSFPLIVYVPDIGRGIAENFSLCEDLAARGFIVASVHSFGSFTIDGELNAADMESLAGDIEFMLGQIRDFPGIDIEKVGILGCAGGGLGALSLGMRNTNIDAVAAIGGASITDEHPFLATSNPYFDPERLTIPFLAICPVRDSTPDLSLLNSLRYSSRYIYRIEDTDYRDLTSYGILSSLDPFSSERLSARGSSYETACEYVLNFFDGYLNGVKESLDFLKNQPTIRASVKIISAERPPPTRGQFMSILEQDGVEKACEIYDKFKNSGRVFFDEATINVLGYRLFQGGDIIRAIMVFEMNADAYPDSPNSWDSLAEACEAAGQNERAIKYLKKVMELLPTDTTTDPQFKELIRRHAEEALARLDK